MAGLVGLAVAVFWAGVSGILFTLLRDAKRRLSHARRVIQEMAGVENLTPEEVSRLIEIWNEDSERRQDIRERAREVGEASREAQRRWGNVDDDT